MFLNLPSKGWKGENSEAVRRVKMAESRMKIKMGVGRR
jgi:hypothetical protein